MSRPLKIAILDRISNSYFPTVAAVDLGCFADEGLDVALELIFSVDAAYRARRDGEIDFVGGSAHSALAAFRNWMGAKLLCAQARGMYWFLVVRADLNVKHGELAVLKGRKIGAARGLKWGFDDCSRLQVSIPRGMASISGRYPAPSRFPGRSSISELLRRGHWQTARSMASGRMEWQLQWPLPRGSVNLSRRTQG